MRKEKSNKLETKNEIEQVYCGHKLISTKVYDYQGKIIYSILQIA